MSRQAQAGSIVEGLRMERRRKRYGSGLVFLAVDPRFDPLREKPDFQAILRSLRLAEVPSP